MADKPEVEALKAEIERLKTLLRESPTRGAIHDDNYWRWRRRVEQELGIG